MSKLLFSIIIISFLSSTLTCDKTQINFLSVNTPSIDTLKDAFDFAMGFNNGLEILRLPAQDDCFSRVFDKEYVNKILHLTDLIKSIDCDTDLYELFNQIKTDVIDVYNMLKVTDADCIEWRNELKSKSKQIEEYFKSDKFIERLALHSAFHFNEFKPFLTNGIEYFKIGDYYNSGFQLGGFIKLFLFWEFNK
jgi:hypothetical protein